MKLYSDYSLGSISMHDSRELRQLLAQAIVRERIVHVIETGTFEGLGSTRFLAETFASTMPPQTFVTIEANWRSWRRARRNLRRFRFVRPLWGRSLETRRALEFLETDQCLREHGRYPDIFIDDVQDPVTFYRREIMGGGDLPKSLHRRALRELHRAVYYRGEGILERLLRRVRNERPLVVLDSAGGVGWLEFQTLTTVMHDRRYHLLLDDVHHIKHFRSLAHIRSDPAFRIIGLDERHGWALATHE
jgi:hypothetical protein